LGYIGVLQIADTTLWLILKLSFILLILIVIVFNCVLLVRVDGGIHYTVAEADNEVKFAERL